MPRFIKTDEATGTVLQAFRTPAGVSLPAEMGPGWTELPDDVQPPGDALLTECTYDGSALALRPSLSPPPASGPEPYSRQWSVPAGTVVSIVDMAPGGALVEVTAGADGLVDIVDLPAGTYQLSAQPPLPYLPTETTIEVT